MALRSFDVLRKEDNEIVFRNSVNAQEFYDTIIKDNEDVILRWMTGKKKHSEIVIATNIISKIKTGDLKLISEED